ncbi:MAG: sialate O-acetylesterase, partial [Defluviitaleaceae bacterium]|nr:sialate O-acetylesterase [Defluviitaleaceae bacterium]
MSTVKLPHIFSDGMVLGKKSKVWGQATPNQHISAKFLDNEYEAISDSMGRFEFAFNAEEFGGPHTLTIEDITISDVYIGRVWLCGGQSNMEGPLSRMRLNFGEHIKDDPRIRIFQAEKGYSFERPQQDVAGEWNTAEGDFLDTMFAVPYFFARTILERYNDAPIGLVCTAAGGTPIEGWLPSKIVREHPSLNERLTQVKAHDYIEKTTAESEKNINMWHENLKPEDIGLNENWHEKTYDDSDWQTRALLDPTGSPEHGAVWLRKQFTLEDVADDCTLNFGRLENSVTVFINGTEVINIGYMYPPCRCKIPDGLLVKGENTIVVRIVGDTHHPYVVPGKEYALLSKNGTIDFTKGKWKWRVGAKMEKCPDGVFFFDRPCGVYNYMLAPVMGYSIDGMIWYQGESNTAQPHNYMNLFKSFVANIRAHYGESLPIIYTQIANYVDPYSLPFVGGFGAPGGYWAILREQQRQCLKLPNTAMAVTIDCGEYNDLHPTDKKTVGERLALHARRLAYGDDIVSDGPTFEKVEFNKADKTIVVHFKNGVGLWAKGGHPTMLVLYKDSSVHSVFCAIEGNKLVTPAGTLEPKAVRFCWADCPSVTVYNAYGLPASPFEEIV